MTKLFVLLMAIPLLSGYSESNVNYVVNPDYSNDEPKAYIQMKQLDLQIKYKQQELKALEDELSALSARIEFAKKKMSIRGMRDMYEVNAKDTLRKIASRPEIYADASQWVRLYTANRDIIKDPNKIYPGQLLLVPRKFEGLQQ